MVRDCNIEAASNPEKKLPILPEFSCHCTRSTFITRCCEKKIPIEIAMKMVGHSDRKMITNVYLTVDKTWLTKEMSVMNDLFNSDES